MAKVSVNCILRTSFQKRWCPRLLAPYPLIQTIFKTRYSIHASSPTKMADHIEIAGMKVPLTDTVRPEDQTDMFPYVKQTRKTEVLPKGWQKASNKRPLPEAIVYDQHIEIPMRDGVKVDVLLSVVSLFPAHVRLQIYADVLRPHDTKEKVPALLAISPYGNGGNGMLCSVSPLCVCPPLTPIFRI